LEVLEQYMKVVGINSDHRIEDDGKHIYVIQHRLGENWSLFIKEFLILLFQVLKIPQLQKSLSIYNLLLSLKKINYMISIYRYVFTNTYISLTKVPFYNS